MCAPGNVCFYLATLLFTVVSFVSFGIAVLGSVMAFKLAALGRVDPDAVPVDLIRAGKILLVLMCAYQVTGLLLLHRFTRMLYLVGNLVLLPFLFIYSVKSKDWMDQYTPNEFKQLVRYENGRPMREVYWLYQTAFETVTAFLVVQTMYAFLTVYSDVSKFVQQFLQNKKEGRSGQEQDATAMAEPAKGPHGLFAGWAKRSAATPETTMGANEGAHV